LIAGSRFASRYASRCSWRPHYPLRPPAVTRPSALVALSPGQAIATPAAVRSARTTALPHPNRGASLPLTVDMAAPADEQRVRLRALLQGSRNATAERHSVPHPLRVREAEVSFERVFDQITLARDEDRRCGRTVPCRRSRSARLQEPPMRSPGVAAQRCRGRLQLAPRTCLADYRFDLWAKHRAHYCLGDIGRVRRSARGSARASREQCRSDGGDGRVWTRCAGALNGRACRG